MTFLFLTLNLKHRWPKFPSSCSLRSCDPRERFWSSSFTDEKFYYISEIMDGGWRRTDFLPLLNINSSWQLQAAAFWLQLSAWRQQRRLVLVIFRIYLRPPSHERSFKTFKWKQHIFLPPPTHPVTDLVVRLQCQAIYPMFPQSLSPVKWNSIVFP